MGHRHLAAHSVHFAYDGHAPVLRGASLNILPGTRTAVLGANGSGKSTLLQCLAGILEVSQGTVTVDDQPVKRTRRALRGHRHVVQLVFQDPDDQIFSADVAEDVGYGPANMGLNAAEVGSRVDRALDLLGISALRDRPTHQLSFGQRKRVAIAGAVAMAPCVLLLDEPTAGIDPVGIESLLATIEDLERAGTTVVMSTHDTALALEWADSVAVVHDGVCRQGPPIEIFADSELLDAAQLRMPWIMVLVEELKADGLLPPDSAPTTRQALRDVLRERVRPHAF